MHWERTAPDERDVSRYRQLSLPKTLDALLRELELMNASGVRISTNLPLSKRGRPLSGDAEDPGVALHWISMEGAERVIACDCWLLVVENMRAILKAVQAYRQLELCGASQIVNRAWQGLALPPASTEPRKRHWREVLDYGDAPLEETQIQAAYRQAVRKNHPDRGGSSKAMTEVTQAYHEALQECAT